jgi:hypothetical protein
MIPHLFTLDTDGNVRNAAGDIVHRLSDTSYLTDFLAGVRAVSGPIDGEIIRDGDWQAWEAATVKRLTGGRIKCRNTGTPQVPAIPGTSPMGFKLPKTFSTYSGRRSI